MLREFVNLTDVFIPPTQKTNSKCFSSQSNHVSCRNITHVLNMPNNFKSSGGISNACRICRSC